MNVRHAFAPRPPWAASAGIVYVASWIIGLLIFSSSTDVTSSGADVIKAYHGHEFVAAVQYVLTEGVPAVSIAIVVYGLARAASGAGERSPAGVVLATGLVASLVSLVQCGLGVYLAERLVSRVRVQAAGSLIGAINRLDGVKMFLLAGCAIAGALLVHRGRPPLAGWLVPVALTLAVTIAISGVGYLFLLNGPAVAAWIPLPLLLVWVCGVGVGLDRSASHARARAVTSDRDR